MTSLTIPAHDGGSFSAYIAMPAVLPAPAVILIQEIFGVNAEMRAKCDAMAADGYIAVCPDLFWRLEPNVDLTDKTKEEWDKALDLLNRFDAAQGVEDLRATSHVFKGHAQSTGKVGCVGFCLGGKLAYMMAARTGVDASVGYYGIEIDTMLDEAKNIKKPLMLHIAEDDKFVPKTAQASIIQTLERNARITLHTYPGVNHAFARNGGEHFDAGAADQAGSRTAAFLREHLR